VGHSSPFLLPAQAGYPAGRRRRRGNGRCHSSWVARDRHGRAERRKRSPIAAGSRVRCPSQALLTPETLEPVRQLGTTIAFIRELGHQQPERLHVAGDSERPRVHRVESYVGNQSGGTVFASAVVAAVDQTGPPAAARSLEHVEEHSLGTVLKEATT
jgi:hypothetical protein